jgi:hypothetical protein
MEVTEGFNGKRDEVRFKFRQYLAAEIARSLDCSEKNCNAHTRPPINEEFTDVYSELCPVFTISDFLDALFACSTAGRFTQAASILCQSCSCDSISLDCRIYDCSTRISWNLIRIIVC